MDGEEERDDAVAAEGGGEGVVDACGVGGVEQAVDPAQRVADFVGVVDEATRHDGEVEGDDAVAAREGAVVMDVYASGVEHGVEEAAGVVVADGVYVLRVVGGPDVEVYGHGAVASVLGEAVESGVDVAVGGC